MPPTDESNPFTGQATRLILETIKAELKDDPEALISFLEWEVEHVLSRAFPGEEYTDDQKIWVSGAIHAMKCRS